MTTSEPEVAGLLGIERGFGGDNATYTSNGVDRIVVCVGWALLAPYTTRVIRDGKEIARFDDPKYVQPHEALSRLGYRVRGTVDFAEGYVHFKEVVEPIKEDTSG